MGRSRRLRRGLRLLQSWPLRTLRSRAYQWTSSTDPLQWRKFKWIPPFFLLQAAAILGPRMLALTDETLLQIVGWLELTWPHLHPASVPDDGRVEQDKAWRRALESVARRLACVSRRWRGVLQTLRCEECTRYAPAPDIFARAPLNVRPLGEKARCQDCSRRICDACRLCDVGTFVLPEACGSCELRGSMRCRNCRPFDECGCGRAVCSQAQLNPCFIALSANSCIYPSTVRLRCSGCERFLCLFCLADSDICAQCNLTDWQERMEGETAYQKWLASK